MSFVRVAGGGWEVLPCIATLLFLLPFLSYSTASCSSMQRDLWSQWGEPIPLSSGLDEMLQRNGSSGVYPRNCFVVKKYDENAKSMKKEYNNNLQPKEEGEQQQQEEEEEDRNKRQTLRTFCFPSVIVAGFPKCGTSYLFHALSRHPSITPTRRKELCLGGPLSETWPQLVSFLPSVEDTLLPEALGLQRQVVMSGCLHLGANIRAMKQLCLPPEQIKLIFMVRDVADMLWASYNYWCNVETDGPSCSPGKHTTPGVDHRSPKLFHDRIVEGLPMGGGYQLNQRGMCYKKDLQRALKVFGHENVLVLKSEDMLDPESKKTALLKLMQFLELNALSGSQQDSQSWLQYEMERNYVVNSGSSQSSKGVHNTLIYNSTSSHRKGLYEASGYKPMMPTTRKYIHDLWNKECRYLNTKFNINYAACS